MNNYRVLVEFADYESMYHLLQTHINLSEYMTPDNNVEMFNTTGFQCVFSTTPRKLEEFIGEIDKNGIRHDLIPKEKEIMILFGEYPSLKYKSLEHLTK